ncbi:hypothetical protein LT493_42520 [Streptomyces tricolor]|nr:hypothetical protein [Streptomyces tricolor]
MPRLARGIRMSARSPESGHAADRKKHSTAGASAPTACTDASGRTAVISANPSGGGSRWGRRRTTPAGPTPGASCAGRV